ncbi:MAG: hypothetical protein EXS00_01935 [Phycisphaerales bacterium]|nr:hypothetical protein [Phycisphaerales bacterium]
MTNPDAKPISLALTRLGALTCRCIVPLWVLIGAAFKLWERNPSLLPAPVLDTVRLGEGVLGLSGTAWFDLAIRLIVGIEVALAMIMVFMPRAARPAAAAILLVFCGVLLGVIVPLWSRDGFAAVLKGSCGCLGGWSPNPLVMLTIDGAMLLSVIKFGRVAAGAPSSRTSSAAGPSAANVSWRHGWQRTLTAVLLLEALVFAAPAPATKPSGDGGNGQSLTDTTPTPPVLPAGIWPGPPAQIEQFYVPEFETWVGKSIIEQDFARLITPAPPADFLTGDWILIFYRKDCDHCEAMLAERFSDSLAIRTLAVAIPDTDPAAALEMPCIECQLASMMPDVQYVVGTPILLRLKNGVVTCAVTDSENSAKLDECLAP